MKRNCARKCSHTFLIVLLALLAGCAAQHPASVPERNIAGEDTGWLIVRQGKNYVMLDRQDELVFHNSIYVIVNNDNEVVYTVTNPTGNIEEREDGSLLLIVGYGTGDPGYIYYDPVQDKISPKYNGDTIFAEEQGLIAYIDSEEDKGSGEWIRKIVIQDLYNPELFRVEYERPIADSMWPKTAVSEADFPDINTLYIEYYTGEHEYFYIPEGQPRLSETIRFRNPETGAAIAEE